MGKFSFIPTAIPDVLMIEPTVFGDARGYFMETYNEQDFGAGGITAAFVQDNQSSSQKGVLRGLHFQRRYPQAKLVRVLSGEVFDVAVDIRPKSPSFGYWTGVTLTARNRRQLYLPRGLAHGFLVLSDSAEFLYKCDEFYHPEDEGALRWDDPTVGIMWPLPTGAMPVLSEKDRNSKSFKQFLDETTQGDGGMRSYR
ncbi:MAG: dTDP-4-dehydrorhamnose 3,5-epimerase [Coriobacteriales bacterium]|jgi:dTDP-4-dehydrorhamnose 3,5-epimerase|nr:dTDP-4-dehydrorhamnose 3,5-epimerase [Coriobacteriales bacterium]